MYRVIIKDETMITGIGLIANERQEHFTKHQQTIKDDARVNNEAQLLDAAKKILSSDEVPPKNWDKVRWAYMITKPLNERIVIAASFLAAELDRLIYLSIRNKG